MFRRFSKIKFFFFTLSTVLFLSLVFNFVLMLGIGDVTDGEYLARGTLDKGAGSSKKNLLFIDTSGGKALIPGAVPGSEADDDGTESKGNSTSSGGSGEKSIVEMAKQAAKAKGGRAAGAGGGSTSQERSWKVSSHDRPVGFSSNSTGTRFKDDPATRYADKLVEEFEEELDDTLMDAAAPAGPEGPVCVESSGLPKFSLPYMNTTEKMYRPRDVPYGAVAAKHMTVSAWVWLNTWPNTDTEWCVVSHGSWENRFKFSITGWGMVLITVRMADNMIYDMSTYMRALRPRQWYHVAATFNGDMAVVIIYINGVEIMQSDKDAARKLRNPLNPTNIPVTIGKCMISEKNAKNIFSGLIGTVRMWSRTLTLHELRLSMLYNDPDRRNPLDPDWAPSLVLDSLDAMPETGPSGVLYEVPKLSISDFADYGNRTEPVMEPIDILIGVEWHCWEPVRTSLLPSIMFHAARFVEATELRVRLIEMEPGAVGPIGTRCVTVTDLNGRKMKMTISVHRAKDKRPWSDGMNLALGKVKSQWFFLLNPHAFVFPGWLRALWEPVSRYVTVKMVTSTDALQPPVPVYEYDGPITAVVSRALYPTSRIRSAGVELLIAPTIDSDEAMPFDRFRGMSLGYKASAVNSSLYAFEGFGVLLNTLQAQKVKGWRREFEPRFVMVDFALRMGNLQSDAIMYAPDSVVVYENLEDPVTETLVVEYMYSDSPMRAFLNEWRSRLSKLVTSQFQTSLRTRWVLHCGGVQGLEGAFAIRAAEYHMPIRTSFRRYHQCEWFETIAKLPVDYKDAMERTRLKSWGAGGEDQVVVYERDYRQLGMWVDPENSPAYVVGRYMMETDGLHHQWVEQCKSIHEVWVPSDWHINMFASQGVPRHKLFKVPEAIDTDYFDPDITEPMYLPGRKGWTFLTVFKMEERKGWKELISAYFQEFTADDDVSLFFHTYVLNVPGDNFDPRRIRKMIMDYAESEGLVHDKLPHFHVLGRFSSTPEMVNMYKAADAFVLASHGEGWGMTYHEAMSMALPTIGTRWSGMTEFMNDDVAYMINVDKMVPCDSGEPWLQGFMWAQASVSHLRQIMRDVYTNRDAARAKGAKARRWIQAHFSAPAVAKTIIEHLQRIEKRTKFPIPPPQRAKIDVSIMTNVEPDFRVCMAGPHLDENPDVPVRQRRPDRTVPKERPKKVAIISTFPPRMCGIGIFANSLVRSMRKNFGYEDIPVEVIPMALDVHHDVYDPKMTKVVIRRDNVPDYYAAAEYINEHFTTLLIQHEFGIFGGTAGTFLLCMLGVVKVPVVLTLHTIKEEITDTEHTLMQELVRMSNTVIVMNDLSVRYLDAHHAIPLDNVVVIPHGVPAVEFVNNEDIKPTFGFQGKLVMVSLGLIGPGKGLEYVMEAVPLIVKEVKDFLMVIAGQPHPACGKLCHDYYRGLHKTVRKYNMMDSVMFLRRSFSDEDLVLLVQATDLFVTAYPEATVSSSGTASLAMSAGRVVVSTPFTWSRDSLRDERGVLVPFKDPAGIARAVIELSRDPARREYISRNAYNAGLTMLWTKTAQQYMDIMYGEDFKGNKDTAADDDKDDD